MILNYIWKVIDSIISFIFEILIFFYQKVISPIKTFLFGPTCRFHPTCSEYAMESFRNYPFWLALYLSIRRIFRCHPWNEGGMDPIPQKWTLVILKKKFTFQAKEVKEKKP